MTRSIQGGTLTDSIAAVEAAWSKVVHEIGVDPTFVIAVMHGKCAIDNLACFKPHLHSHEMEAAVEEFEQSILFYADAYTHHRMACTSTPSLPSGSNSDSNSCPGSGTSSGYSSVDNSSMSSLAPSAIASTEQLVVSGSLEEELVDKLVATLSIGHGDRWNKWELEAAEVDRTVHILPGVKTLLKSILEDRYAIATSGAKTYGTHCPLTLPFSGISPCSSCRNWTLTSGIHEQHMVALPEWVLSRLK